MCSVFVVSCALCSVMCVCVLYVCVRLMHYVCDVMRRCVFMCDVDILCVL